jgi:type I restriction enzyme S subunit
MYPVIASTGTVGFHHEAQVAAPGVVIGRSGSIGGGQYITTDFWPLNTTLWVKEFKGNHPRFCYYLLRGIDFSLFNVGSGVPTLNRNHIHPLPVVIPQPHEQAQIAALLGALDDKIELNRRMNETLEAMAQAIFRDWFVDFGPVRRKLEGATDPVAIMGGLVTDPVRAAELAGLFPGEFGEHELPLGWSERPIGDLVDIAGGSTPSTADDSLWQPAEHRWATPKDLSNMSDLALFNTGRRISSAGLAKITSGLLPAGTVLLSSRAPIGYLAIAQEPVAINQGFIALRPTATFSGAYLYLWCKANMEAILANANGSTFQEISKKNFRPITSAVPDDGSACRAFGEIAESIFARIVSAAAENRTLAETRDYLLPRLMSGEVRVGEAGPLVSA